MRALLARLLALFHRRQLDRELSDEMSTHLELSTADLVASGLSLEDARRAAALRFGGTLQTAEPYRDQQGFPRLESWWQDVRYAVRTLRKNPAFATTAGATLALAIGAQTSIYCLINTLFLRPPAGVTEAQRRRGGWVTRGSAPRVGCTERLENLRRRSRRVSFRVSSRQRDRQRTANGGRWATRRQQANPKNLKALPKSSEWRPTDDKRFLGLPASQPTSTVVGSHTGRAAVFSGTSTQRLRHCS